MWQILVLRFRAKIAEINSAKIYVNKNLGPCGMYKEIFRKCLLGGKLVY